MGIAVIAVLPKRITNDSERLMGIFLLLCKEPAENGIHAQSCEGPRSQAGPVDLLRSIAARNFIGCRDVAAHGGKRAACIRVNPDLSRRDGRTWPLTQAIS